MEDHSSELRDYINIVKRKKISIFLIMSILFFISILVAVLLPPTYKSEATILIEQQDIPTDMVRSTVTSFAAERIQTIRARAMSRTNLLKIIDKFNLYEDERKKKTTDEVIQQMREAAKLDIVSAEVVDPASGRPGQATIAFSVSYEGKSPRSVQKVTSELTSLYLNENIKNRTKKAEETSTFLREEANRLGALISLHEKHLAEFKQKNAGTLPEVQAINIQFLQRSEAEIAALSASIQSLQEKMLYIEGQMNMLELNSGGTGEYSSVTRLKLAEDEYARASARYSPNHPDIVMMKREIEVLRKNTDKNGDEVEDGKELADLKSELEKLQKTYTDSHPDVVSVKRKIAAMEVEPTVDDNEQILSTNPMYVTLKTQMVSMGSELRAAEERKLVVKQDIVEMEENIFKAPQIEREYLSLTRDYTNAVAKYQEIKAKEMQADVAQQLETESKGERFTLIDPPLLPEKPISPNRPAIIILGLIFSIGGSVGYALLSSIMSGLIQGARHIEVLLGAIPLSVIPVQYNERDLAKRSKIQNNIVLITFVVMVVMLILVHFLISPLDVLWFRGARKVEGFVG